MLFECYLNVIQTFYPFYRPGSTEITLSHLLLVVAGVKWLRGTAVNFTVTNALILPYQGNTKAKMAILSLEVITSLF